MRVVIDSADVKSFSGTNARGPWEIRSQLGYADMGKRYPSEVKIRLKDGQGAYPPGEYEVDLCKSTYVSKYGALALSEELVLVPAVSASARAPAAVAGGK
jgi:hypothetical protein